MAPALPNPNSLRQRVIDASISLAFSPKAQGIVAVWAQYLRGALKIDDRGGTLKTACVDEAGVWIAPTFLAELHIDEVKFLIAHETLHLALDFVGIARALGIQNDPEKHDLLNVAQDAVINDALVRDGIGKFPGTERGRGHLRGILLDDLRSKGYTGEATTTAVYWWLVEEQKAGRSPAGKPNPGEGPEAEGRGALRGCGPTGFPGKDAQGDGQSQKPNASQAPGQGPSEDAPKPHAGLSPVDVAQAQATLREISNQAGKGSAIGALLTKAPARTSYKDIVRAGFEKALQSSRNRTDPTYARAGRRPGLDSAIVTSGRTGREARLAFVGDVSGSISRDMVAKLQGHVAALAKDFPDVKVYLVTHTDEVVWAGWLREGGDDKKAQEATAHSGGTDFAPAYEKVREAGKQRGRFDCLVHFTDGYNFSAWPESPARQTIIALCGRGEGITTPPNGARILKVSEG